MTAHAIDLFYVETHQEGAKFINPGKGAFTAEAILIDFWVKQALATAFGVLAVAFVFGNVGNDLMGEADLASLPSIKGAIGIKVGSWVVG
jgi:hypothetical protein